jgi:hypothetical protein
VRFCCAAKQGVDCCPVNDYTCTQVVRDGDELPLCVCKVPCGKPVNGIRGCCKFGVEVCIDDQCVGPTCGPDITDPLADAVSRTKAAFLGWSRAERDVACRTLAETPVGLVGWEINQLGPGKREEGAQNFQPRCVTATCGKNSLSVQVGKGCHYAGSVNYVIYGVMMRLCHSHFEASVLTSFEARLFTEEKMTSYITIYKKLRGAPNLTASLEWAKAGYNGWPSGSTPAAELPNCGECPKPNGGRLTVRWLPLGLNI